MAQVPFHVRANKACKDVCIVDLCLCDPPVQNHAGGWLQSDNQCIGSYPQKQLPE